MRNSLYENRLVCVWTKLCRPCLYKQPVTCQAVLCIFNTLIANYLLETDHFFCFYADSPVRFLDFIQRGARNDDMGVYNTFYDFRDIQI